MKKNDEVEIIEENQEEIEEFKKKFLEAWKPVSKIVDEISKIGNDFNLEDESEEEKEIPEKLDEYIHTDSLNYNQCNYMFEKLTNKYNELIDYLKSKGE